MRYASTRNTGADVDTYKVMESPTRALTRFAYPSTPPYEAFAIRHADVPGRRFSCSTQSEGGTVDPRVVVHQVAKPPDAPARATSTAGSTHRRRPRAARASFEPI